MEETCASYAEALSDILLPGMSSKAKHISIFATVTQEVLDMIENSLIPGTS